MKRPADQAKLLFLYLLRSSAAALATPANRAGEHILLRVAKRADVPSIQRCNLATLPENYNSQFYVSHMRQWPDLCLVAEHVIPSQQKSLYSGFPGIMHPKPEAKIVGYVLGKVEQKSVGGSHFPLLPDSMNGHDRDAFYEHYENQHQTESVGHVTSLAVLQEHRRCGLAGALMKQLHCHLEARDVPAVGLHVRKSNVAAARLYESDGYTIENIIPHYYQDGEDAYFMRKGLNGENKIRPWEHGPYQLPRKVLVPVETVANPPAEPQISISGTM
jgi:ribosomal protein S18 acetylase RimI-like enzyme